MLCDNSNNNPDNCLIKKQARLGGKKVILNCS
uniref:Uncharacterized protein n=1 Tax=Anguilla anguilla TaxID=7936 RepID=A0A0E9T311_ANGAN